MARFVKVAERSELPKNGRTCVDVEGRRIALFDVDGELYAVDDLCTHEEAPLSEGEVENGEIECPWHGATFNLKTGECTAPPAEESVRTYSVRVTGGAIEIGL